MNLKFQSDYDWKITVQKICTWFLAGFCASYIAGVDSEKLTVAVFLGIAAGLVNVIKNLKD